MGTYVAFTTKELEDFFTASKIAAEKVVIPGTYEIVYHIPVVGGSGRKYPAIVQVYSSIAMGDDVTRDVGKDAIRIKLINTSYRPPNAPNGVTMKGIKASAFRTKNALPNMRDRIRAIYGRAMRQTCSNCDTMMVFRERVGKYGCPNYLVCKGPMKDQAYVEEGTK